MTKRIIELLLPVLLSLAAWGLWLYEINYVKGWYGLTWLDGSLFSPYYITALVVLSFLLPFILNKIRETRFFISAFVLLYIISWICYVGGKLVCYEMYARFVGSYPGELRALFISSALLFLACGLGYRFVTHKLITPLQKRKAVYLSFSLILVIPLSLLTVYLFPGFGDGKDWIDAVKMGYPVFWVTIILGYSGYLLSEPKVIS